MMFFRFLKSLKINRILVVSLSNIGDVVLTFPVLDVLHARFPDVRVDVIVGPKAAGLLAHIPWINVVVYDKKMTWQAKCRWLVSLRQIKFDLVVDLRNSMLPFLLDAAKVTLPTLCSCKVHMKQKHLKRLKLVLEDVDDNVPRACGFFLPQLRDQVDRWVGRADGYVIVAPGAADQRKRWTEEGFAKVLEYLHGRGKMVVLLGDKQDAVLTARLIRNAGQGVVDLCGKTSLAQLMPVIERASFALTNDSGLMHLLSYAGKPVVALFGPTDPFYYGPWSDRSVVLRQDADMGSIPVEDVLREVKQWL
ncbi:MAG: glycosyltransferase family 9 protein [Candidatus Omnitrophota bacterium]